MEDKLLKILRAYGCPVFLQGSLGDSDPYPDRFFTYWNNDSASAAHYDNKHSSIVYDYDVNYYGTDAYEVYATHRQAIEDLRAVGFIISGDGYSVATDEPEYCGRGVRVYYKHNL